MRQKSGPVRASAEQVVKDIRRATRRQFSAEEKIRIVLEGLRGEESIAELCRREGIVQNLYYRWSKDFLEAGKKRLAGDTARAAMMGRSSQDQGQLFYSFNLAAVVPDDHLVRAIAGVLDLSWVRAGNGPGHRRPRRCASWRPQPSRCRRS